MIKLAYLGTGYINSVHIAAAEQLEDVHSFAVYSRDKNRGKTFATRYNLPHSYTDYDELLSNPEIDALIIGLPTPLHKKFMIKAAEAKKHVLCEKPIAKTIREAKQMIAAAEKSKIIFMVGQVLRFWPEYVAAKSIVDGQSLGKIKSFSAFRLHTIPNWSSGNWLLDPEQSGGVPVDLHIHDLDFCRWLMGEPLSVHAIGTQNTRGLIENVVTLLKYKHAVAQIAGGYILPQNDKFQMGFTLFCEYGTITYDNLAAPGFVVKKEGKVLPPVNLSQENAYVAQLRYFVNCIQMKRAPTRIPSQEALKSLELALQVKKLVEHG